MIFLFSNKVIHIMGSCDTRSRAYKNGRTFDQCKEIAKNLCLKLKGKIDQTGEVSWSEILESADHDELVYKLTLKYLREGGYDIGNWKIPRVAKFTA